MHRPIPILQKADAALSSLINNLTTSNNNLNQIRASPTSNKLSNSGDSTKPSENLTNINGKNLNFNENNKTNNGNKNSSNNNNNNNNNNTNSTSLANKATCDLNELIKLQQQQQQLFSTLRSNSIISNSPLMFNHNCNTNNNNASNNNSNSNGSNNFLTNYSSNSNGANVSIEFSFKINLSLKCENLKVEKLGSKLWHEFIYFVIFHV